MLAIKIPGTGPRSTKQRSKRRLKMRNFWTTGALVLAVSLIPAALPTFAQSTPDSQSAPASAAQDNSAAMTAKAPTTTVTGCIAAGKKDGTFKLTADDGTTYMLRSRNTNFADHVGHTVTVTGHVMTGQMAKGGANGAAAPSGDSSASGDANQNAPADNSGAAMKHGMSHLMVRSMTMVSETCKAK
jgi:hypothetical protein